MKIRRVQTKTLDNNRNPWASLVWRRKKRLCQRKRKGFGSFYIYFISFSIMDSWIDSYDTTRFCNLLWGERKSKHKMNKNKSNRIGRVTKHRNITFERTRRYILQIALAVSKWLENKWDAKKWFVFQSFLEPHWHTLLLANTCTSLGRLSDIKNLKTMCQYHNKGIKPTLKDRRWFQRHWVWRIPWEGPLCLQWALIGPPRSPEVKAQIIWM